MLLKENYYLKVNRLLGEDISSSKIVGLLKTIISKFGIDTSNFTDPNKLKNIIMDNSQYFDKANELYNRFVGVKSEGREYMSEGIFDFFRGLNKGVVAMFVAIALSGMANSAHASVDDLIKNARAIADNVKVIQSDYNDARPGWQTDYIGPNGPRHYKQVLDGLDKDKMDTLKQQAEKEGIPLESLKNMVALEIAKSFLKSFKSNPDSFKDRIDNMPIKDFEKMVNRTIRVTMDEDDMEANIGIDVDMIDFDADNIKGMFPDKFIKELKKIVDRDGLDPSKVSMNLATKITVMASDYVQDKFGGAGTMAAKVDQYLYPFIKDYTRIEK